jgi:hypothetical protein
MKRILTFAIASFIGLSCTAKNKAEGLQIPIIKYNPATYLSDIESALVRIEKPKEVPKNLIYYEPKFMV